VTATGSTSRPGTGGPGPCDGEDRVRVGVRSQNDDSQLDDPTAYGCDKIFTGTASNKNAARPELDRALAYLRAGDVFVITRLSGRCGR
jgi:DNA invertase Pin-like site-specific DNA recombinase